MRLIDADELKKAWCEKCDNRHLCGDKAGCDEVKELYAMPTIEAEPKHGRWISTWKGYWHKCSVCGGVAIPYYNGQDILSPYCPWCGAKMDEVEE